MTAPPDSPGPVEVYVSAGSNVNPEENLRLACRELRRRFGAIRTSAAYRNPAVGFQGDDFLNLVLSFRTTDPAEHVVAELERLHGLAGRVRVPGSFSPRTLDLDLLLYGTAVIPGLRVPREDIRKYAFVLGPLAELAPDLRHPVTGETMAELWSRFDHRGSSLTRVDVDLG